MLALLLLWTSAGNAQTAAATTVPLADEAQWQVLRYSKLPPHRVRFSKAGLEIAVDGSAMPLVYPLAETLATKTLRVRGRLEGRLNVPAGRQGEAGFDDYAFRIGLVEPGKRTLGTVQRRFAASWVRKLFELAPPGSGISGIHFFNVGVEKNDIGKKRQHPLSDLIQEEVVTVPRSDGRFDFEHTFARPLQTIAIWLSSDGDDTKSKFTVLVEQIELLGQ